MIEHIVRIQPNSVVDVGCGYGKWGFLVREALDFVADRHERDEWAVRIDGIDAFPQHSPLLEWVYDTFRIADVLSLEDGLRDYDVVILGDVIEHIDKEAGQRLIDFLVAHNRCVLLNTPREFFAQGEIEGNPFERHLSFWAAEDFVRWPAETDVRGGTLTVALRGAGGSYPSDAAIRASRIVRRIPGIRSRGAASAALKEALTSYVLRRR
jgi:2-polyprenyl-3-methyl-5-hydroxy-6-metoxy-1,4-benzoquinol methylase